MCYSVHHYFEKEPDRNLRLSFKDAKQMKVDFGTKAVFSRMIKKREREFQTTKDKKGESTTQPVLSSYFSSFRIIVINQTTQPTTL